MGRINSRQKGKRGEREAVRLLRLAGINAERMAPMQAGLSTVHPDVKAEYRTGLGEKKELNIECKWTDRLPHLDKIYKAHKGKLDMVMHHRNHGDNYVIMTFDKFVELLDYARDVQVQIDEIEKENNEAVTGKVTKE